MLFRFQSPKPCFLRGDREEAFFNELSPLLLEIFHVRIGPNVIAPPEQCLSSLRMHFRARREAWLFNFAQV